MPQELEQNLVKAFLSNEYFITISFKNEGNSFSHYWETRNFPEKNKIPSLQSIEECIKTRKLELN